MNWKMLIAAAAITMVSCGSSDDNPDGTNNGGTGKGDDIVGPGACGDFIENNSFNAFSGNLLETRTDAFAIKGLREGDSCPQSFSEIMDKLRETDGSGCSGGSGARKGIDTHIASEFGQLNGTQSAAGLRALVTRRCDDRDKGDMVFSLFGINPSAGVSDAAPVEVASFDEAEGVYNYYILERGTWHFHGTGHDWINEGQETNQVGAVQNEGANNDLARCSQCHTGSHAGQLVMKEQNSPWLHWENGGRIHVGAEEMVAGDPNLGAKKGGQGFEKVTRDANVKYNESLMAFYK